MKLNNKESDELLSKTDKFVAMMLEHGCDCVQVICTVQTTEGNHMRLSRGGGSIYARLGATRDWLDRESQIDLAKEISTAIGGSED